MAHNIGYIVALLLLIPGVFMAFVPMLPTLSYMFIVALLFGIYDKFTTLSWKELLGLLVITLVSITVDHTSGLLGAKYGGAHTKSLLWGIAGGVLGALAFPPFGSFIGLFLAVLIAEIYYEKPHDKALKAAGSALVGTAVGVGVNVILAALFIVLFFFFALK